MVLHSPLGNLTVSQCEMATNAHGQPGCCETPTSSLCNRPLVIPKVEEEWDRYNFDSTYHDDHLPFSTIQSEIDAGRPIEVGFTWSGGGGHAVLVVGYEQVSPADKRVFVYDPWHGPVPDLNLDELRAAYGAGTWRWSWYRIQRR